MQKQFFVTIAIAFFVLFSSLGSSMQNSGGEELSNFSHCCAHWITCATFGEKICNNKPFADTDSCISTTRCLHATGLTGSCLTGSVLFGCALSGACCNPTAWLMHTAVPGTPLFCPCLNYSAATATYKYAECLGANDFIREVDRRRECAEDVDCNPRAMLSWFRECFSTCFGTYDDKENSKLGN